MSQQDEKDERRLDRQLESIESAIPHPLARALNFLRRPAARLIRVPLGVLFVLGGVFSILPLLGIWMLPLGLLLLAVDLHLVRGPITRLVGAIQLFWRKRARRRAAKRRKNSK